MRRSRFSEEQIIAQLAQSNPHGLRSPFWAATIQLGFHFLQPCARRPSNEPTLLELLNEMVNLLYTVAGILLILALIADHPFTKTNLLVFATASFLLARFSRIERRLDRIEGIQRSPRLKRAASWAWSKREFFIGIGYLAFVIGLLWWSWGSISDELSAISPKLPHPWLHAVLASNPLMTALLVWLPIGAMLGLLFVSLIAFYILSPAMLLGWSSRGKKAFTKSERSSKSAGIAGLAISVLAFWMLFVMTYAEKESDAFFALFPDRRLSNTQVWIMMGLLAAWMPLGLIAVAVQRRREKAPGKLGQPSP